MLIIPLEFWIPIKLAYVLCKGTNINNDDLSDSGIGVTNKNVWFLALRNDRRQSRKPEITLDEV
jgi:hypothetical protein